MSENIKGLIATEVLIKLETANNLLRRVLNRRHIGESDRRVTLEPNDLVNIRIHLGIKIDGSEDFINTGRNPNEHLT